MSVDCSRFPFQPWKDYLGVIMQQGRVQLDADWNEWVAELGRRLQAGTMDVLGPAEAGRAWDFENNGMIDALAGLIDGGRIKLYCVDSADAWTWSDRSVPTEERARRHGVYEGWIHDTVVPWVRADCGDTAVEIATLGFSPTRVHPRMPAHVALDTEATATAFVRTCECCRARPSVRECTRAGRWGKGTHVSRPCEC